MAPSSLEPALSTLALHADDVVNATTDVAPPIHLSTTFRYDDNPEDLVLKEHRVDLKSHIYSRITSPNTTRFETILSSLMKGHVLAYGSGLSALHAALVFFNPRRISMGKNYHGCHDVVELISRLTGLQKLDLDCSPDDLEAGDVIFLETPLNPHGTAFNIKHYAEKAHSRGVYLIVDSTFAPPGLQDPFKWGADLVLHSGSKYLGGHSDLLCGVLVTQRKEWVSKLLRDRAVLGSIMGNLESWLGVRSLRTLEVRVQRQSQNAERLVSWLDVAIKAESPAPESDEAVVQGAVYQVEHASLQRNDMSWLQEQMPNGYGSVFSMVMKEEYMARELPSKLTFFHHATSLGSVETLIEWRALSDDRVDRRLMRISVGLENWEDLKSDLIAGFKAVAVDTSRTER